MFWTKRLAPVVMTVAATMAVAVCAVDVMSLTAHHVPASLHLLGPLALAGLGGLLLLSRYHARRALAGTAEQLERLADSDLTAPAAAGAGGVPAGALAEPLTRLLARCRQDVQALRDANAQLQVQLRVAAVDKRQAEAIVQSIRDPVLVTNRYDELILANSAALELLHLAPQCTGRRPLEQVLPDARLIERIREARVHGGPRGRTVEHAIGSEGRQQTFQACFRCIDEGAEGARGVVTTLQDITREKEIGQIKTEFVSTVSHELRAPLAGIKAYVEMLLDGEAEDPATRREFHQIIAGETERLARLIDNILNLSRIEASVVKVAKEPVDLTAIVKQVLEVAGPQASARNLQVVERLGPVFAQVEADRDMLSQAVTNLVSNAVKYTPDGGRVTVSTVVDEARGVARVEVQDTGVGIAPEDQPRVFEKFYRVHESSGMAKGTGLGLSLVKHIVEDVHGGTVTLTSQVGRGSTFVMELPLCPCRVR